VWRSADRVFAVTQVLKRMVVAAGVCGERVTVVPNGIDPAMFAAEPHAVSREGAVTLGFIGFVRDWHGLDRVIESLAGDGGDPPIRLVVVGDGPARPRLQRQAAALGLGDRVRFVDVQPRGAVAATIRQFDIALQPKVVPYASPLKIFEYMACGRAIVAPDQANIREILVDGETALLFDPDEPAALWRAIRRLADNPELRDALGRAARRAVEAGDYTWRRNALRIIEAAGALPRRGGVSPAGAPVESF
jgi:glycosyltransferase involved in cell wall biosynthesis